MHKTYKWKLRGFFWLFNLILQLDNFIKSYLTFSFCRSTFDGSSGLGVKLLDASNATNIFRLYIDICFSTHTLTKLDRGCEE